MSPPRPSSSLDILLPERTNYALQTAPASIVSHFITSPSCSPASSSTSEAKQKDTIKQELERISSAFENVIKNGQWVALKHLRARYISPPFHARFDNALISSWTDYVTLVSVWTGNNPWQKSVLSTEADVDEENGQATVYILMKVTGWPTKFDRMVVSVLKWKKLRRRWVYCENTTMRGVDTFRTEAGV
ncbi:hypothetical protein AC578_6226 [Pseudocercospora eumusae]|uniref:SnoaL-like domain-containing protein n=1 Tax=Pseudocercospora eumusae TaxID=321146 RepID=A0A139H392_9PEZI|nr:hypothetical protein AC578_6226 [Pseudocercospora eumusae]